MDFLTDYDIKEILTEMEYQLTPIVNENGELLPAIERAFDSRSGKQVVLVRRIQLEADDYIVDKMKNLHDSTKQAKHLDFLLGMFSIMFSG